MKTLIAALAAALLPAAALAQQPPLVRDVDVRGVRSLDPSLVRGVVTTPEPRCRSPFLFVPCALGVASSRARVRLDTARVREDAERIDSLYAAWGYPDARTSFAVDTRGDRARVTFTVAEGRPTVLRSLTVLGLDSVSPPIRPPRLPLAPGDPYAIARIEAAERAIAGAAAERGHAFARVEASGDVHPETRTANLTLTLVPGPVGVFGTTEIAAEPPITTRDVQRRLAWRPGERFSPGRVRATYERLTSLPIVQEARVEPVPNTAGDSAVNLRIAVTPTRVGAFQAEGVVSSSTCIGGQAYASTRYLFGAPRVVTLSAGAANLLNSQLRGFPCTGGAGGEFSRPDWFVQGEWREPVGADTWLLADLGARRALSPRAYVREGVSGLLALSRRVASGLTVQGGIAPDVGDNRADVPFFCAVYGACSGAPLARLTRTTTFVPVEASVAWSPPAHRRASIGPRPGPAWAYPAASRWIYNARATVDAAPGGALSSVGYARGVLDANLARLLGPRTEVAARVRAGVLAGAAGELPPNLRIYGGGPLGVRGAPVNLLGPKLLVLRDSASLPAGCTYAAGGCTGVAVDADNAFVRAAGGTLTLEGGAEARLWATRRLMLAAFVDAGYVRAGAPASALTALAGSESLVTPGVGVQAVTPFGPVRVDVAYNPSPARTYPFVAPAPNGDGYVVLGSAVYDPFGNAGGWTEFRRRLQLQLTMGTTF
jgi:translocation and assembly module TamA